MQSMAFNTSNETFRKLLADKPIFRVPRFQRDYSWSEENWEDLWLDILDILSSLDDAHYMGYLVLQSKDDGQVEIIDGQQRLTTISIVILAAMRHLRVLKDEGVDAHDNELRLNAIRGTYIGQLDPVSLRVRPKLSLNRNNDAYYQTYLATLRQLPSRGFKPSEHLLRKASDWFHKKIGEHILEKEVAPEDRGAFLASFVESVTEKLFFTVITVSDELNAYKVFETLNARGVKLAAPDLLKNYLFSVVSRNGGSVHDDELDELEKRWSEIISRLQSENLTSFLRTFWGSRYSFVRQADLFKSIKRQISTRADVYDLVRGLEDDLDVYLALSAPDQSDFVEQDKINANLLKSFSVRQPFALLMAAKRAIPDSFSKILRIIVQISFRYNVIGSLQAAEQERTYSRVAQGITEGKFSDDLDVIMALRSVYPSDEVFESSFASKEFDTSSSRNRSIVKYILGKIEEQETGTCPDVAGDRVSIEHILPENPGQNWSSFSDSEAAAVTFRIGNLTLLERSINKGLGNKGFRDKQSDYRSSGFSQTRNIGDQAADWTADEIQKRQKKLARVAKTVWRVDQLS